MNNPDAPLTGIASARADGASSRAAVRYLQVMVAVTAAMLVPFIVWGVVGKDHFAAIPRGDDPSWYRNYDDGTTRSIQDRDVFYHNIGHSIDNARAADIIVLGHSMVLWGLRDDQLVEFGRKHGVKIFNMASAGDGSGEFLRLVIERWQLHPKLWIINADDHAANFFSVSLDDFGNSGGSAANVVVKYSRLHGFFNVVGRNLRWRLEDFIADTLPAPIAKVFLTTVSALHVHRSVVDGNWDLQTVPAYNATNPYTTLTRDQNCPATPAELGVARSYVAEIGGSTILTLFPYNGSCPQRVKEIAAALGLETIIPPDVHYTTTDQAHLDKRGATEFTAFFLAALEQTEAFRKIAPR